MKEWEIADREAEKRDQSGIKTAKWVLAGCAILVGLYVLMGLWGFGGYVIFNKSTGTSHYLQPWK